MRPEDRRPVGEATIAEIRARYPSVRQVVLQPVVGGPSHESCTRGGELVRASWQHAHIDPVGPSRALMRESTLTRLASSSGLISTQVD